MSESPHLRRLTSLRGFAALGVFVCHVCSNRVRHGYGWWVAGGPAGVGFFFVLSGFVLAWAAGPSETARALWRRRFARIYPATAVSIGAAVVLAWLSVPHMSATPWVLTSFGLINSWLPLNLHWAHYDGNPVTWSLVCEAFFYALLPLLLRARERRRSLLLAASLFGAITVFVLAIRLQSNYLYAFPPARLPEFALGVVMGSAARDGWMPNIRPLPALAVLGLGWYLAGDVNRPNLIQLKVDVLLPGAVAVILAAFRADAKHNPGCLTSRPMVYLGELSFCFYLTHQLCLRVIEALTASLVLGAVVGLPLALATAMALHHGVELPMQRRLMRPAPRPETAPVTAVEELFGAVSPDPSVWRLPHVLNRRRTSPRPSH